MKKKENTETIELDFEDSELLELCMQAHEKDITLNQHIVNILQQFVDEYKENDPQLLNEEV